MIDCNNVGSPLHSCLTYIGILHGMVSGHDACASKCAEARWISESLGVQPLRLRDLSLQSWRSKALSFARSTNGSLSLQLLQKERCSASSTVIPRLNLDRLVWATHCQDESEDIFQSCEVSDTKGLAFTLYARV